MRSAFIIILLIAPFILEYGGQRQTDEIEITTSSQEARVLYMHAREFSENMDFGNAILLINKALKIDPGFALAYLLKARQTMNSSDQAYNLRKAEELTSKISQGERYLIQYYIGVFKSNTEMQKKFLNKLTEYFPGDKRVQFLAASEKYLSGDYQAALNHLIKAIKIDPFYYPAYSLIGYCKAGLDEGENNENLFQYFQSVMPAGFTDLT